MYQQYPPPEPAYYPQQQYSGCMKALLYILSFVIPLAGVIIGIVFSSRPDQESKSIGTAALILGIVGFVVNCCVGIAIMLATGGVMPFLMEM